LLLRGAKDEVKHARADAKSEGLAGGAAVRGSTEVGKGILKHTSDLKSDSVVVVPSCSSSSSEEVQCTRVSKSVGRA